MVSVIIPCHNMADTLPRAVESALEAGEVLLYDDASTDQTAVVCWQLSDQYPAVRFIRSWCPVPLGVCAARNILIARAGFPCIVPLDADDYFLPGGLQMLVEAHREGRFVYGGWRDDHATHHPPPVGMLRKKNVAKATFLFEKKHWLQVGGYSPLFNLGAEDYAFMLALAQAGVQGISVDYPVYHYTDHTDGRAARCKARWPLIQDLLEAAYGIRP